jgi:hypothetical protein
MWFDNCRGTRDNAEKAGLLLFVDERKMVTWPCKTGKHGMVQNFHNTIITIYLFVFNYQV